MNILTYIKSKTKDVWLKDSVLIRRDVKHTFKYLFLNPTKNKMSEYLQNYCSFDRSLENILNSENILIIQELSAKAALLLNLPVYFIPDKTQEMSLTCQKNTKYKQIYELLVE